MQDREFEWDSLKAAANRLRHGIAFEHAVRAVIDPRALETIDDREDYGEERINLIGMGEVGVILHVTYTERGQRIRIISARRANKHEREEYYRASAR
jgi:uncharacterized protein